MTDLALRANQTVSHLHPAGSFALGDHPVPSGKEEFWRFTPTGRLGDFFDDQLPRAQLPTAPVTGRALESLARRAAPRGTVLVPVDRSSAIAARVERAAYLPISGQPAQPIRLTVTGEGDQPSANHLVIEAQPGAQATVLISHTGAARHIGNVEILVGEGAQLTVVSLQDWAPGSVHLGQHEALVGPGAQYRHIAVSLGGTLVRLQNNVSYAGLGGQAELYGVYFAGPGQHLEHRLFVDHNQPKGVSQVDYRGALQGERARSVWVGDVLIRPQAVGISTYESNKNLVLTDGCRADAVPNLEIETGQIVGAGHSASTGRFDDEQLFYLRSRGIDEAQARRLVVHGFFAAILAKIGIGQVEQALLERIDAELAGVGGPGPVHQELASDKEKQ
jgi:Fe-S cluster assembly protein SufD